MKNSELIQANIKNLTSLWKTAGMPFKSYVEDTDFDYCIVPNSEWPNRLWFNREIKNEKTIQSALDTMTSASTDLVLPWWDLYNQYSYKLLEENGFRKQFEQVGMSLRLKNSYQEPKRLQIITVSTESQAELWATIYPRAFGYQISRDILINTLGDIDYYLALYQDQPVGTAIQFNTNNISGIHGVGVIPEMRRKGFAGEIMRFLLNRAADTEAEYVTLQASDMGKGLYLKLGFEEQFIIKNYRLPRH